MDDSNFKVTVNNQERQVQSESVGSAAGNVKAHSYKEKDKPPVVSADLGGKFDKYADEENAAQAFAKTFNAKHGTKYDVEKKLEKDASEFPDRILKSNVPGESEIWLEMTYPEEAAVESLGKTKSFVGELSLGALLDSIRSAVHKKASAYGVQEKSKTHLILQYSTPLPTETKLELQKQAIETEGFAGAWLYTMGEDCIETFNQNQISEAAYFIWQNEGPYWGNDQYHWFQALQQLSGTSG